MSSKIDCCIDSSDSAEEISIEAAEFDDVDSLEIYNYGNRMLELFSDEKDGVKNLMDEMERVKLEIAKKERDADMLRAHRQILQIALTISQSRYPYSLPKLENYPRSL